MSKPRIDLRRNKRIEKASKTGSAKAVKVKKKSRKVDTRSPLEVYNDTAKTLAEESPMEKIEARRVLSESVAVLRVQLMGLLQKQADGTITSDETRAIPAVASNIRRNLDALGVTDLIDEGVSVL